jgi:hypothetical protein
VKNRTLGLSCLAAALALGSVSATAAVLEDVRGTVLVNQGDGFKRVKGNVELSPGDLVVVHAKSGAVVRYDGECRARISPDTVFRLDESNYCGSLDEKNGPVPVNGAEAAAVGAAGAAGGAAEIAGLSTTAVAAGVGAAAAAAVGIGYLANRIGNQASP